MEFNNEMPLEEAIKICPDLLKEMVSIVSSRQDDDNTWYFTFQLVGDRNYRSNSLISVIG